MDNVQEPPFLKTLYLGFARSATRQPEIKIGNNCAIP